MSFFHRRFSAKRYLAMPIMRIIMMIMTLIIITTVPIMVIIVIPVMAIPMIVHNINKRRRRKQASLNAQKHRQPQA
jgi:heme exporter protein D